MRAAHVTDFKADLDAMLDRVADDHVPLIVTREGKRNLVVVSEEDWAGMEETLHLLSNPANAADLLASIEELRQGKIKARTLVGE